MDKELIYDITDKENSLQTLENLTGLKKGYWELYTFEAKVLEKDIDETINDIIERFNLHIDFVPEDMICNLQHITTSANNCKNIRKNGLRDLVITYTDLNSELRKFLDEQQVIIDLEKEQLLYNGKNIGSIHFSHDNSPSDYYSKAYYLWSVGRKFYYDFCVCGFYSFDHADPYGGNVHERPEILYNISQLIGKRIDNIWRDTHKCYIIKFKVPFINIHNDFTGDIRQSLLYFAFKNAMRDETDENIVLVKDRIQIAPEDIVSIERFDFK